MLAIEVTDSERSLRMQLGVELTGAENSCRVRSVADRESAVMQPSLVSDVDVK